MSVMSLTSPASRGAHQPDRNLWISPLPVPKPVDNFLSAGPLRVILGQPVALSTVLGVIAPGAADKSEPPQPRAGGQAESAAAAACAAAGRASAIRDRAASSWAADKNQAS